MPPKMWYAPVEGVRREYLETQIAQFIIYCFGNQGYRVFAL
ncbi:MAG: hypothetical protein R3E79_47565 [Caldilineaceae bacterium]